MKAPKQVHLVMSRPSDDKPSRRMSPAVQRFTERVQSGDPIYAAVLGEITDLQILGVEITVELMDRVIDVETEKEARRAERTPPAKPIGDPERVPMQRKPNARFATVEVEGEVVYYVRIGNRVKIGTSTNLRQRLADLNPEELLAVERGGRPVEAHRHRQFADLRTHGEWFRYEGRLAEYIASLRE